MVNYPGWKAGGFSLTLQRPCFNWITSGGGSRDVWLVYSNPTFEQVAGEIEQRYQALARVGVRDITAYHQIVMIDNLYDLMLYAPQALDRVLTQGVHLGVATRANVATLAGSIKANFPARLALRMADKTDAVQLLDVAGAEKLLGRGDMLYKSPGAPQLQRVQGIYLAEAEIKRIVDYWWGVR